MPVVELSAAQAEPVRQVDLPRGSELRLARRIVTGGEHRGGQPNPDVGCLECRMTGYRGRAGLYELLTVGEDERQCISPTTDVARLRKHALHGGLRPLRVAGAMKVAEGLTTLEEVLRATPAWQ